MSTALKEVITQADKYGLQSIAIPVLGSSIGYKPEFFVTALSNAI